MLRTQVTCMLIALGVFICLAQTDTLRSSFLPDSIQVVLDAHIGEDQAKVHLLYNLGIFCFYDFQYRRGLQATLAARKLALKLRLPPEQGLYFKTMKAFHQNSDLANIYNFQANRLSRKNTQVIPEETPFGLPVSREMNITLQEARLLDALRFVDSLGEWESAAHICYALVGNPLALNQPLKAPAYKRKADSLLTETQSVLPAFESKLLILGLSLAYDIIKSHGGELKADTDVGIGSEFIVQLPVV